MTDRSVGGPFSQASPYELQPAEAERREPDAHALQSQPNPPGSVRAPASKVSGHDPSWSDYAETILEFPDSLGFRVDLRSPLTPTAVARLGSLGIGDQFAVVTPCNPQGRQASASENAMLVARLRADLLGTASRFVCADGISADGRHREAGFAIALPLEEAVRLARGLEQSALFWFDTEAFWLVPVLATETRTRLPRGSGLRSP